LPSGRLAQLVVRYKMYPVLQCQRDLEVRESL